MKILIADDHALFRDSLRSLLEARGLTVVGRGPERRARRSSWRAASSPTSSSWTSPCPRWTAWRPPG